MTIKAGDYRGIVVLTGAGISVASGIRPYRGPGGLWNDETLVKYSHIDTFRGDPLGVWDFWWKTREAVRAAKPNAAHDCLARLEAERGGAGFTLITQNIDGLHLEAGSREVVEYHGNVRMTRCSDPRCGLPPFPDDSTGDGKVPLCPRCGKPLRPDIVLFGEAIPTRNQARAMAALAACDLFVAVGTSGTVYPAAGFVGEARAAGARTVYVNLESILELDPRSAFGEEYLGRAEEILPALFGTGS